MKNLTNSEILDAFDRAVAKAAEIARRRCQDVEESEKRTKAAEASVDAQTTVDPN